MSGYPELPKILDDLDCVLGDAHARRVHDAIREYVDADRAMRDAWRPIESAPKDGSRFLAWEEGQVRFFHWQEVKGNPVVGWRDDFIYVFTEGDKRGPSVWMPLPQPPKA